MVSAVIIAVTVGGGAVVVRDLLESRLACQEGGASQQRV